MASEKTVVWQDAASTNRRTAVICILVGLAVLTSTVLVILFTILRLNDGTFTYLLDDAYIHLSMAENIARGTYGVNPGETAATASSILWPFLLAPFAGFDWFPLILNFISGIGFVFFVSRILLETILVANPTLRVVVVSLLLVLVILSSNLIPIIFMGMEHGLQLVVIAWIVWGMVRNLLRNETSNGLYFALFLAPLIRFENGSVVLAALLFLFLQKFYKKSILTGLAIAVSLAGFSLFLISAGQQWLPASILAKTVLIDSGTPSSPLLMNLISNLKSYYGIFAMLGALSLLVYAIFNNSSSKKRILAAIGFLAIMLHLALGGVQLGRYESYSWTFLLLVGVFISGGVISRWINWSNSIRRSVLFSLVAVLIILVPAIPNLFLLTLTPSGSHNIYSQQFQMHRFATDFYQAQVAVNDLGYVSYKNENYVLDLWGLASLDALRSRKLEASLHWMAWLTDVHEVGLVMIYTDWFDEVPPSWIKVGDLILKPTRVTAAGDRVTFYATTPHDRVKIESDLRNFIPTLPASAEFIYWP